MCSASGRAGLELRLKPHLVLCACSCAFRSASSHAFCGGRCLPEPAIVNLSFFTLTPNQIKTFDQQGQAGTVSIRPGALIPCCSKYITIALLCSFPPPKKDPRPPEWLGVAKICSWPGVITEQTLEVGVQLPLVLVSLGTLPGGHRHDQHPSCILHGPLGCK